MTADDLRVYPRTCGGTWAPRMGVLTGPGLSPHVRGNPNPIEARLMAPGSIPARAGEPAELRTTRPPGRVYPRTCGGTLGGPWVLCHGPGSIPARAGEPRRPAPGQPRTRVYPRTCGGTGYGAIKRAFALGLSPHVRGNHVPLNPALIPQGSIPARAGEPGAGDRGAGDPWVYPRTCGGTYLKHGGGCHEKGLSPHVRGNLDPFCGCATSLGSIPARAGEPRLSIPSPRPHKVYPRTCGGTRPRHSVRT